MGKIISLFLLFYLVVYTLLRIFELSKQIIMMKNLNYKIENHYLDGLPSFIDVSFYESTNTMCFYHFKWARVIKNAYTIGVWHVKPKNK